jgi:hypothetical protein
MKKYWFEILLVVIGALLFFFATDPDPKNIIILQAIELGMVIVAIIWFFTHRNMAKHDAFAHLDHLPIKNYHDDNKESQTQSRETFTANTNKEVERKRVLDEQIALLSKETEKRILAPEDVNDLVEINLNSKDHLYICQNMTCPLLGETIWNIKEKIDNLSFSDEQIIKLFKYGTDAIRERLITICKEKSWTMQVSVFDYLFSTDKLMLLTFPCYTAETFKKLIDKLGPYECLGYRTQPRETGEETQGSLTVNNKEEVPYYEDVDTDIVYIVEQDFSDNDTLRKYAFDKVFTGPYNLTEVIGRLDSMTEYEVQKIFERGNAEEVEKIFDRSDSDNLVNYFPPKYAIKVILSVIPSDYSDTIHENFDFESVDHKIWFEVFEELTADELAGYRMKPQNKDEEPEGYFTEENKEDIPYYMEGDHDIMKLIEDHAGDDDDLRMAALKKVLPALAIDDVIDTLDGIRDNEAKIIMEIGSDDAKEALLDRNDSDNIIGSLPDDIAIKIRLELIYPSASDNVKDNYSFNNSGAFMKVIEELSPYELLGYRLSSQITDATLTNLENPDEKFNIANDADYDIIRLIEEEMKDDVYLRKLAFEKMCKGNNMVDAIARWSDIKEDEIAVIIERGFTKEIEALIKNDNGDEIMDKLPDNYIIKEFLLHDDSDINDEYNNRIDNKKFRQQVETIASEISNEKLDDDNEDLAVEDLSDDQIIRITLGLINLNDYSLSFESDDVRDEFVNRMDNDEEFKAKVEKLIEGFK